MVLEVLVAVIDGLHSVPLPRIPPGHGHRHRGGDGVAVHGVVDHSRLELLSSLVRGDSAVSFP